MKYIEKKEPPSCLGHISSEMPWEQFHGDCRDIVMKMLHEEQKGFCAYCERNLSGEPHLSANIEHLVPQSTFIEETNTEKNQTETSHGYRYKYTNMVLSCFGYPPPRDDHALPDNDDVSCNQHKKNQYDAELLLDPTSMSNISDYFSWRRETGEVMPSDRDRCKATYMIKILNLDCQHLKDARMNAAEALLSVMRNNSGDISEAREEILKGRIQFSSFLKHCFAV